MDLIIAVIQPAKLGKVFVLPVSKVVRIRTGEQDHVALGREEEAVASASVGS